MIIEKVQIKKEDTQNEFEIINDLISKNQNKTSSKDCDATIKT